MEAKVQYLDERAIMNLLKELFFPISKYKSTDHFIRLSVSLKPFFSAVNQLLKKFVTKGNRIPKGCTLGLIQSIKKIRTNRCVSASIYIKDQAKRAKNCLKVVKVN